MDYVDGILYEKDFDTGPSFNRFLIKSDDWNLVDILIDDERYKCNLFWFNVAVECESMANHIMDEGTGWNGEERENQPRCAC